MKKTAAFLMFFLCFPGQAPAKTEVIDGDSLMVDGVETRLEGIDAPEYHQECYDKNRRRYRCGAEATAYMQKLVKGKKVFCRKLGTDRYKRQVAVCYADGKDINREMVRAGMAVAYDRYSDEYVADERDARKNKRGIWQGKFMKPELWRRLQD